MPKGGGTYVEPMPIDFENYYFVSLLKSKSLKTSGNLCPFKTK